jgi:hypothetical protein
MAAPASRALDCVRRRPAVESRLEEISDLGLKFLDILQISSETGGEV